MMGQLGKAGAAFLLAAIISSAALAADKFGQDVPAGLEQLVDQARQQRLPYSNVYDPKTSAATLERVIAQKADYYRALFNLGLAYHELKEYQKSVETFDAALRIREAQSIDDATILNTAGWVALKNGDFGRAEALLKEAETETKGDGTFTEQAVLSNLGELYFLTQRLDLSRTYFNTYKANNPTRQNREVDYYLSIIERTEQLKSQPGTFQLKGSGS